MESMLISSRSLFSNSVRSRQTLVVVAYVDCDAFSQPSGPDPSLLEGAGSDMASWSRFVEMDASAYRLSHV